MDGDPRIEFMDLEAIPRAPRNPKGHDLERIEGSFDRFGFVAPPMLDESTGRLVAGHGRLDALVARKRAGGQPPGRVRVASGGAWLVPVIRGLAFASPEDAELYLLADNKLSELGGWDEAELGKVLSELAVDDVLLAGWTEEELARFAREAEAERIGTVDEPDDAITDLPDEPRSMKGEVYELGPHRLMCGDATVVTDVEALMAGDRADLVFTDPPYNVSYVGKTKDALTIENDSQSDEEFEQFLVDAFSTALIAARPGAGIYVCHADSTGHVFRMAFTRSGWLLKQCIVWVKDAFVLGRQDYHWRHEPILYGWAPNAPHTWHGDRKQSTVWEIPRPRANAEHPTMKPLELVELALDNSSARDEVVLDLFGGSGTTVIAAARKATSPASWSSTRGIALGDHLDLVIAAHDLTLPVAASDEEAVERDRRMPWHASDPHDRGILDEDVPRSVLPHRGARTRRRLLGMRATDRQRHGRNASCPASPHAMNGTRGRRRAGLSQPLIQCCPFSPDRPALGSTP